MGAQSQIFFKDHPHNGCRIKEQRTRIAQDPDMINTKLFQYGIYVTCKKNQPK